MIRSLYKDTKKSTVKGQHWSFMELLTRDGGGGKKRGLEYGRVGRAEWVMKEKRCTVKTSV